MSKLRAIVVAGTASRVGKTTVTCGLMALLRRGGLKVQPFKIGPDYIDPSYHTWVTGEASRNLDTWMLSREAVVELFHRAMAGKDIAVIEGVMGLYDGRSGMDEEGSTAEVAKLLGAPVLLVVDARKAARSLAAMVGGYRDFDPDLRLGGVILNGIGSDGHLALGAEAIKQYCGIDVVGHLHRAEALALPERYLGLVPTVEDAPGEAFLEQLMAQCESSFAMPGILRLAETAAVPRVRQRLFPPAPEPARVRIGLARDRAFSFYYQDSLDLLEAWGAEMVPFSPLEDESLPDVSALYIGGGFPELYAGALAENHPMKMAVKRAVDRGMPVYAECGGLMYLGGSMRDLEGKEYAMCGALPVASRIDRPRLTLGYRTVCALDDGPLLRRGEKVRGHEFHWSLLGAGHPEMNCYQVDGEKRREGFHIGNVFATYIHLHLGSRPGLASRFVAVASEFRASAVKND